jgi:hypothetical protein
MFEAVIEKFDRYWNKMDAENPANFSQDLASEVRKRLEQLDYLYELIMEKHQRYMDLSWKEVGGDWDAYKQKIREAGGSITKQKSNERFEMEKLVLEIEVFTESFYYLAHRTRVILRNSIFPFPGLKSFECEGVRNVRNKLLEHPEKEGKILVQNFGMGGEQGPTLKPDRPEGQENIFPDSGLEVNTLEFKGNLEKLLDGVLAQGSTAQ